jgi:Big-like domain-containing protein
VPGVPLTFVVATGGGSITGANATTNASGVATVGSWKLGTVSGSNNNTLTATVTSLTPATITASATAGAPASLAIFSGDNQNGNSSTVLPNPLVVVVADGFSNPVPAVTVSWTPSDGNVSAPTSQTGANGQASVTWTLGTQTSPTVTAGVTGLTSVVFHATVIAPNQILLSQPGIPGVGVGQSAQVDISLTTPAPAGGKIVTLAPNPAGFFTVAPGTVNIAQGQTTGSVQVTGVAVGTATLDATAPGYVAGSLSIDVQSRAFSVPTTLSVPFGQTASMPIQISAPAPAGGVVIDVVSDAPTLVQVQTPQVTIPAGSTAANATLFGALPGVANVTASNAAYATPQFSIVTTSASLNIIQASLAINQSFGGTVDVHFESNGQGIPAPPGGVSVTYASADPTCVQVVSPTTIPAGLVTTSTTASYGGTATLPCNTMLLATTTPSAIQPDSVPISVAPTPPISLFQNSPQVGSGLQDSYSGQLGASNHGGATVTIKSSDPTVALVSPNASTAGSGQITVNVLNGQTSFSYAVQVLEGKTGAFTITAQASGFTDGTLNLTAVQPGFEIQGLPTTGTTFSADIPFYAQVGLPNGQLTGLTRVQNIRAGAPNPVDVTFTDKGGPPTGGLSGTLVTLAGTGASRTVQIPNDGSRYYTATQISQGGVGYRALTGGTDSITAVIPGYLPMSNGVPRGITVSQPPITINAFSTLVGQGLTESGSFTLGASNHGGVTVTYQSLSPGKVLISKSQGSPGVASDTFNLLNGQTNRTIYFSGLEGIADTAYIKLSAPGFTADSAIITVVQPGVELVGPSTSLSTASGVQAMYAQVGIPNGQGTALQRVEVHRAGAPAPLTATFTSRSVAIGAIVTATDTAVSEVATIPNDGTVYYTPTTVAGGGVGFLPLSGGQVDVVTAIAGFQQMTSSIPRTITVSQPTISVSLFTTQVGSGLSDNGNIQLSANQIVGGVDLTLTSLNSGTGLVAPNSSTAGTPSFQVHLNQGTTNIGFAMSGLEGQVGPDSLVASAPGYASDTVVVDIVQPGVEIQGLPANTTTLSTVSQFYAQIGLPNANNTSLIRVQNVRAGAPAPYTVTFTSAAPSIGDLIVSLPAPDTNNIQTAQIPVGFYYTPTSLGSGGVAFRPILGGSTDVSAGITGFLPMSSTNPRTVTVTQPGMSLSVNSVVGSGLLESGSGTLAASNHGGVTVTISSSDPTIVTLSKDAATAGTGSIQIFVPDQSSGFNFFIQGMEGKTGTVGLTATASGFTNGTTTAQAVQPGIELAGVPTSTTTLSPNTDFYAQIGVPNANNTSLNRVQNVRPGGPSAVIATFSSSSPAFADLATQAGGAGSPQNVQIPTGFYYTPTNFTSGGVTLHPVSAGTTTVSVVAPGFTQMSTSGLRSVTVTTPVISLSLNNGAVAGGLQENGVGNLGASNHGGVTVTLTSGDPTKLLIAPNGTTQGTGTLQLQVANNQSQFTFVLQGLEGQTGNVGITATVDARFVDGSLAVPVVQPGIEIQGLSANQASGGPDQAFYVQVGLPNSLGTGLQNVQSIRFGAPGPLDATLTTSDATVAGLINQVTSTPVTSLGVQVPIGQYYSPTTIATGGIGLRPIAPGVAIVRATASGYIQMSGNGVRQVNVQ